MRIFGNMNSLTLINHLKRFQRSMNTSIERMTLGQRLNSPADGPADYAMSERFRTSIVANRARQSNIQSALSYMQTAQNGLDEFATVLNDIKDEVTEMIDGTANPQDRAFAQMKIDEWMAGLDDIAKTTHYNKHYMFRQASNPTGRTNTLVAFGPDLYEDLLTATGVQEESQQWNIDNELQDIARSFLAENLGGTYQDLSRTFEGGYLEDIADAFTIGVDSEVPTTAVNQNLVVDNITGGSDAFVAGSVDPTSETFDVVAAEATQESFVADQTDPTTEAFTPDSIATGADSYQVVGVNPTTENFTVEDAIRVDDNFTAQSTGSASDAFTADATTNHLQNFVAEDTTRVDDAFTAESAAVNTENFTADQSTNTVENFTGEETVRVNDSFTTQILGSNTDNFTVDQTSDVVENFTGEEFNRINDAFTAESAANASDNFTVGTDNAVENFTGEEFNRISDNFTAQALGSTTDTFNVTATDNNVDTFTVDATHATQDTDTHEGIQTITNDDFAHTAGQTAYTLANAPNAGTFDLTISQAYTAGEQLDMQSFDTRRAGGTQVGDIWGDFEVTAIDQQGDGDYNSVTLEYIGLADNITVEAHGGENRNDNLKQTFTSISTGDTFTVDYGNRLNKFTTLVSKAQADTSLVYSTTGAGGTEALTEGVDFSISGNQLTLEHDNFDSGRGLNTGATFDTNYESGTADHTYALSETPLAGTLEVRVDGVLQDASNYTLNGTDLTVHDAVHGAAMQFDYTVGENISDVTLSGTPVSVNSVEVNGVAIAEDAVNGWSLSGDQIIFNGASQPFHADDIEVDFETAASQDTYTLTEEPNAGSYSVLVNGVAADAGDYNINGTTLTFTGNIPGYGDTVEVSYDYGAESQFTLSDDALADKLGTAVVTVDGQAVAQDAVNGWSISGDQITFNGTSAPTAGDAIAVDFDAGDYTAAVTLAETPEQIDQVLVGGVAISEDGANGYTISGDQILFHGTAQPFYGDDIVIDYEKNAPQDTFNLSQVPNEATMEVLVNGVAADPADWDVSGNTLTFTTALDSGDTLEVNYGYGAEDTYTLSDDALADRLGTASVTVGGQAVAQDAVNGWTISGDQITFNGSAIPSYGDAIAVDFDAGEYTDSVTLGQDVAFIDSVTVGGLTISEDAVNGWTRDGDTITFNGASKPFYGDAIEVDYEANIPQDTFTLDEEPNAGTLSVLVNGVAADPADYTVDGTSLTFNTALDYGDTVEASYDYGAEAVYTLSDNALADQLGTAVVTVNGQAVAQDDFNGWHISGNTLTLTGTAAPEVGDTVAVDFDAGGYTDTVTLAGPPDAINTITVDGVAVAEDAVNGWTASGDTITFNGASKPIYGEDVVVDYEVATPQDTFTLAEEVNAGTAEVQVNGVVVDPADYTIDGNTLTFNDPLNYNDQVEVSYGYGAENEFTLSDTPVQDLLGTAVVTVDGQQIGPDPVNGWSITGDTLTLNGSVAPAFGDEITIGFDAALPTDTFTLEAEVSAVNSVTVNGVAVSEDAANGYTVSGTTLTFNGTSIPTYGDEIAIDFEEATPESSFTLTEAPNAGTETVLVNGVAADPADYTFDENTITFTNGLNFGDAVQVDYDYGADSSFTLSQTPATANLDTAVVTVGGQTVLQDAVNGWTVTGDTITFNGDSLPAYNDAIDVSYDVETTIDTITLGQEPKRVNTITVNGVEVAEDGVNGWTNDGSNVITFHGTAQPVTGDEIVVDYDAHSSQSVFTLSEPANAGTEEVLLNGVLVDPADYTLSGDTLTFTNNIPQTGDDIDVTYGYGATNTFTLNDTPPPELMGTLEVTKNGVTILEDDFNGWTINGNDISLNGTAYPVYGDDIQVSYELPGYQDSVTLGQTPLGINTVTVNGVEVLEDAVNGYTLDGDTINFNGTAKPYYGDTIDVDYDMDGAQDTFTLAEEPYGGEPTVQVNGQVIDPANYTVDGTTLTFQSSIPVNGDQVQVDYNIGNQESVFELSGEPVGNLEVTVNGQVMHESTYSVDGSTLTFDPGSEPPPASVVAATYDQGDYLDRVALDFEVVPGSMQVTIDGQALAEDPVNGWTIEADELVFHGTGQPFYGEEVDINYDRATQPNTYLLDNDPYDAGTFQVQVNGVTVDPAEYTITDNEITFDGSVIPQNGDAVQVDYQLDHGNTDFDLAFVQPDEEPNPGSLLVTLNGVEVDAAEYQLNGTSLEFTGSTLPAYGDTVDVEWNAGNILMELDVFDQDNPIPNDGTLTVFKNGVEVAEDAVNGWTFDGQKILLNGDSQGIKGDEYDLQYQIGEDITEFTLDQTPNAGSVEVLVNGVAVAEDAANGWSVADNVVTLNGDSVPGLGDAVEINYDFGEAMTQMTLSRDDLNPDSVTVRVNGEYLANDETNGFTVAGDVVTFHGDAVPVAGDEINATFGVGDVMNTFELQRLPTEGTFQLTIDGQAIAEDAANGYTLDTENRIVTLNGGAIPADGDLIEYSYDYVGGEEEDFSEPFQVTTGLVGEKIDTGLSMDLTLTGMDMESLDVSSMEAAEASLAQINQVIARVEGIQTVAGTHEARLETTLEILGDEETRTVTADDRIRGLDPEAEMVNYMATQAQSELIYSMLSSGGLNTSNVMSLLGSSMGGGGGFGF